MWGVRASGRDRNYVVIKHSLRGINGQIHNVKFRNSYAVVDKDSKTYRLLKKFPNLGNAKEFPLTHLRSLPFITRDRDIRLVYGEDVYISYLKAVEKSKVDKIEKDKLEREQAEAQEQMKREAELAQKEQIQAEIMELETNHPSEEVAQEVQALEAQIPEIAKCIHRVNEGTLCKYDAAPESPSGYCNLHILKDPKLPELGIDVKFVPKKELKEYRDQVINKLAKMKSEGKF
jgi:hypothetical protein